MDMEDYYTPVGAFTLAEYGGGRGSIAVSNRRVTLEDGSGTWTVPVYSWREFRRSSDDFRPPVVEVAGSLGSSSWFVRSDIAEALDDWTPSVQDLEFLYTGGDEPDADALRDAVEAILGTLDYLIVDESDWSEVEHEWQEAASRELTGDILRGWEWAVTWPSEAPEDYEPDEHGDLICQGVMAYCERTHAGETVEPEPRALVIWEEVGDASGGSWYLNDAARVALGRYLFRLIQRAERGEDPWSDDTW